MIVIQQAGDRARFRVSNESCRVRFAASSNFPSRPRICRLELIDTQTTVAGTDLVDGFRCLENNKESDNRRRCAGGSH
jgi:hypothetical protein